MLGDKMNNNDKEKQLPSWVYSARQSARNIRESWETINNNAAADISRGLEIQKIARGGIQSYKYIENTLNQNLAPDIWDDKIIYASGESLAGTLSYAENTTNNFKNEFTSFNDVKQSQHEWLIDKAKNIEFPSGTSIYMSAQIEYRIETLDASYQPIIDNITPNIKPSRSKIFEELTNILQSFDPRYLNMLKGSENALQHVSEDHLSQAAHSMRDLFQQIIEEIAPTAIVILQPWFSPTKGAPNDVSRLSRIRYILYESGDSYKEDEILMLEGSAKQAKIALDLAMARAHDHDPSLKISEVEGAIDQARFSVLEILKRHKKR